MFYHNLGLRYKSTLWLIKNLGQRYKNLWLIKPADALMVSSFPIGSVAGLHYMKTYELQKNVSIGKKVATCSFYGLVGGCYAVLLPFLLPQIALEGLRKRREGI